MINKELSLVLDAIMRDAARRRHEYLTAEHILFALVHDEAGMDIIAGCGGDVLAIREELEAFFAKNIPVLPPGEDARPEPAIGFQRVIQRSVNHVHSAEKAQVEAGDLLAALYGEADSFAVSFLEKEGISRLDVLHYISHGGAGYDEDEAGSFTQDESRREEAPQAAEPKRPVSKDPLKLYAVNLNEKAAHGEIDRPRTGDTPHHSGAVPAPEKQYRVRRRAGRGQDRSGRGTGFTHPSGEGAGTDRGHADLRARYGCAAGRHEIPG